MLKTKGGIQMDAKKLGIFIAEVRKEKGMTQSELSQKLHVTDKAVSRWERGLGFPDINTIEPLADALGVSIIEIMKGERVKEEKMDKRESLTVFQQTVDVIKQKRKKKNRILAVSLTAAFCLIGLIFFFPMKLEKQLDDTENLVLLVNEIRIEDGMPIIDQSNYTLEPGTIEFAAFQKLLGQYTYYRNLSSFFPEAEFKGGDFYISVYSGEKLLSFSQTNQMIIDGRSYTLGYWGVHGGEELLSQLEEMVSLLAEK